MPLEGSFPSSLSRNKIAARCALTETNLLPLPQSVAVGLNELFALGTTVRGLFPHTVDDSVAHDLKHLICDHFL